MVVYFLWGCSAFRLTVIIHRSLFISHAILIHNDHQDDSVAATPYYDNQEILITPWQTRTVSAAQAIEAPII